MEWAESRGTTLYPAQEEAILELLDGNNVILNTPTGSGKSMVALALHFDSVVHGRKSVYTCPIKALVNEKWMALCKEFGAENVGLSTGDATVNRDAPILCCTAEILSNMALSEGEKLSITDVVMDEFHYYSDRERAYRQGNRHGPLHPKACSARLQLQHHRTFHRSAEVGKRGQSSRLRGTFYPSRSGHQRPELHELGPVQQRRKASN